MPSTFFGLTIANSGLNAAQAEINTTANNISNVETKGYSKQVVNVVASSALRVYQRYGSAGTGVEAQSVTQRRDQYYDEKYWNNQGNFGFYDKMKYYMNQIESYYSEVNNASGFSTIYGKMFNALDSLKTNAGDASYRKEFISNAQKLCDYFSNVAINLEDLQSAVNDEIKATVDQINSIGKKISILNKQINILEMEGGHANELRDQRALLVDELSLITSVQATETKVTNSNYKDQYTGATYYTLKINGQILVNNYEYNELKVVSRDQKYNQSDIDGLYDIVWAATDASFDALSNNMSGSLKAMFEVRDGNDQENITGRIQMAESNQITISNPSINNINNLNLPIAGTVFVGNTKMTYKDFDYVTDASGVITSITFNLEKGHTDDELADLRGKTLEVGRSVNYMGIPYYMNQMNEFVRNFSQVFNGLEREGVDLNGNAMGSFFAAKNLTDDTGDLDLNFKYKNDGTDVDAQGQPINEDATYTMSSDPSKANGNTYYQLTARNCKVMEDILNDPRLFSTAASITNGIDAYDIVSKLLDLEGKIEVFRGGAGDKFLQCIYADVTVDTQECTLFTTNYTNISATIDNQRKSISGVDNDEEALDLVRFQNAYNLAAKCIKVYQEIYDQLILNTGV